MANKVEVISGRGSVMVDNLTSYRKGLAPGQSEADFPRRITMPTREHAIAPSAERRAIIGSLVEPILALKAKGLVSPAAIILFGSQVKNEGLPGDLDVLVVINPINPMKRPHQRTKAEDDAVWDAERDLSEAEKDFYGRSHDVDGGGVVTLDFLLVGDTCTKEHKVDCVLIGRELYLDLLQLTGPDNQEVIAKSNEYLRANDPAKAERFPADSDLNWLQNAITTGSILIWGENIPDASGSPTVPKQDLDFLGPELDVSQNTNIPARVGDLPTPDPGVLKEIFADLRQGRIAFDRRTVAHFKEDGNEALLQAIILGTIASSIDGAPETLDGVVDARKWAFMYYEMHARAACKAGQSMVLVTPEAAKAAFDEAYDDVSMAMRLEDDASIAFVKQKELEQLIVIEGDVSRSEELRAFWKHVTGVKARRVAKGKHPAVVFSSFVVLHELSSLFNSPPEDGKIQGEIIFPPPAV